MRYQRAYAFVDIAVLTLTDKLGFKEVDSGENIALVVPYDEGVYYGSAKMDGVMVASPVQVYLDALSLRGRGEEAAQAILEEILKPQW